MTTPRPKAVCEECGTPVDVDIDEGAHRDYGEVRIFVTCPNCGDMEQSVE